VKRVSPIIVGHGLRVIDSVHRAMTFAVHCTLNSQTTTSLTTSPSPLFTWRLPGPAQHRDGLVTLGTGVPPGRLDGYLPLEPSNQSRTPHSPIHPVPANFIREVLVKDTSRRFICHLPMDDQLPHHKRNHQVTQLGFANHRSGGPDGRFPCPPASVEGLRPR
jgi:hypothetical protein